LVDQWHSVETYFDDHWFDVKEFANELGSVISVTCVDIYLGEDTGKDTAH